LIPGDLDDLVSRLQWMHANVTRSQHPLHPALLERLDAAGIFVWQLVGPGDLPGEWTGTTRERLRTAVRRARATVLAGRLHPSVLTWSLVNEIRGNGVNRGQRVYVARTARALRRLDPGRPLALDVWGTHLPHVAGAVYRVVDLVGATNYEGWYANLFAPGRILDRRIRAWLQRLRRTFPDKPLVVTEFGAEGHIDNRASAPGGFRFQARLLARHIRRYSRDRRLTGMLVWALQDFALRPNYVGGSIRKQTHRVKLRRGLNQKGLFTYDGRRKPAAHTVSELYSRPPAPRRAEQGDPTWGGGHGESALRATSRTERP
jgi:hypothetical protein